MYRQTPEQRAEMNAWIAQMNTEECSGVPETPELLQTRARKLLGYVMALSFSIDQLEGAIDSAIDDLEAIKTCSDERVISDCAESAQAALLHIFNHEEYRASFR